jgi:HEAT repeat protein
MTPTAEDAVELPDIPQLIERLGSAEFAQAQAAAAALQARGQRSEASAREVLEALVTGLAHPNWRVRKECAALMDHLGDDRCVEPLRRALTDPRVAVRRLALHSLGCQPCKTAPLHADIVGLLIERAQEDPSRRVRQVATHLLGLQPPDPRTVPALQAILAQDADPKVRSRAEHALRAQAKRDGEEGAAARCQLDRPALHLKEDGLNPTAGR